MGTYSVSNEIQLNEVGYLRGDGFRIPVDGANLKITREELPFYSGVPSMLQGIINVRTLWEIDISGHDILNSLLGVTPRVIWRCDYCGNLTVDIESPCCGCGGKQYSEFRRHAKNDR